MNLSSALILNFGKGLLLLCFVGMAVLLFFYFFNYYYYFFFYYYYYFFIIIIFFLIDRSFLVSRQ